jgi:perosamine synthetase
MIKIPLANPILDDEMMSAAMTALKNERFILGESVHKFEEEFAKYIGTKHAIAVNSGTSALNISMQALGFGPKDVVATTPNSFVATGNAILHTGARPTFFDIEPDTGNIDADRINPKGLSGIIPVHIYGHPANMGPILDMAEENGMLILEDACQAHGAEYKGKKVGTLGDVGCFSFYPSKNMTVCGDGGMIVTNNAELAELIRRLRDCGRKSKYEHDLFSHNYRINSINGAIGRIQLRRLDEWNRKRREAIKVYRKTLPKEVMLSEKPYAKAVYYMVVIKSEKRDDIINHLDKVGVQTGVHYPIPIHLQPFYRERFGFKKGEYPIAEKFAKQIVSLPMYPDITKGDVKFICESILEVL